MKYLALLGILSLGLTLSCKKESIDPESAAKNKDTVRFDTTTSHNPGTPTTPNTPDVPTTPTNSLDALPKDTGGTHTAMPLGKDKSPYGYYIYTPSGYTATGPKFPLVIFLHGSGEIGNSQTNAATLDKILVNGPPRLIKQGKWNPVYPMIVASAQCHEGWWDYQKVRKFIEFVRANYQVDTLRVYLTGLSMGGYGTYDQLTTWGKNSHITAAVPISGSGVINTGIVQRLSETPVWAFHGAKDQTVSPDFDKKIIPLVNALNPKVKAKLTIYPNAAHDAWSQTYDGSGKGKEDPAYDPFDMDVFAWLLQYSR